MYCRVTNNKLLDKNLMHIPYLMCIPLHHGYGKLLCFIFVGAVVDAPSSVNWEAVSICKAYIVRPKYCSRLNFF